MNNNKTHKTKIGGQAVIEGVMMRGIDKCFFAVRSQDNQIDVEEIKVSDVNNKKWYLKIPVIRGVFGFIDSLKLGYICLNKSIEKAFPEEETEEEIQDILDKKKKSGIGTKIASVIGTVLGVVLALGLFMFLPSLIVSFISEFIDVDGYKTIIEGVIKITLFVLYLVLVSQIKDIKRTFQYHGAEHKTIACYEAGEELTIQNAKKHSRLHPRCGTSFLLISLILSIIIFSVVTWNILWVRFVLKIALLPIVIGIAYEIIKIAGRYDNKFTKIISFPGKMLQKITTKEPDDSQLEVAIEALKPVLPKEGQDDRW